MKDGIPKHSKSSARGRCGPKCGLRYLESLLNDAGIQMDGVQPLGMRLRRAGVAERILAKGSLRLWPVALYHLRARWFNLQTEDGVWPRSLRPGQRLLCQPCWISLPIAASGPG